ncbi:sulfotransferase 1C2 [Caerostris extrusa]|uniref:Sulfotransferase 1C2 n=1 Tax=Caerostris extrusa TaxID=172846 RepID=A0AAV4MHN7_CAEEX|nr:sulfotransferase 1C2 [Caerostris extrusa]
MAEQCFGMPPSNIVDGFRMPHVFSEESFRSATQYKPRPDDVFLITYPKCGTTWAQQIIGLIFKQDELHNLKGKLFGEDPFLELRGAKSAETMARPGVIKTHLPFNLAPWSDEAKYIHIARNPKDCCVSFYHHNMSHGFNGSFDQFFEMFLSGKINFGDYFDHLLSWFEHRNDPNVLFLTYEDMKKDPANSILKIASFIDEEKYGEPLKKDFEKLNKILEYSSFQYMKEAANNRKVKSKEDKTLNSEACQASAHTSEKENHGPKHVKSVMSRLVRKGVVGDWRNHFSEEQNERLNQKFAEKTKGTDLENIWMNYM